MASSLTSLALGKPITRNIAMTGELTLTGKVLPVGGVKEKVIAAKRAGIAEVILPIDNERDYDEMPDYLKENLPSLGVKAGLSQRDTYYWYYATQVMFHMGGEHWKAWNERLHPLLVNSQVREGNLAGSWDFRRPVMDRWGPHAGRIYLTTMNLLSLEVHYRHLPLYEESGKSGKVAAEQQD